MIRAETGLDGLLSDAIRRAQEASPDRIMLAVGDACEAAGITDPCLFLIDHHETALTPAPRQMREPKPFVSLPVHGSIGGQVFTTQQPALIDDQGGVRFWLPVSESHCRLGVLALRMDVLDEDRRRWCLDLADVVAQLVRSRQQYSDTFVRARRLQPMSLAAELQWNLLPPLDFTCHEVGLCGIVAPAYDVGGDVFDYAMNDGVLHFGLVDCMGHALNSAIVSSLVIGTYRNRRRELADLVSTVETLDASVADQFDGDRFATLQLGELDTKEGVLRWVNAGHPLPYLLRGNEVRQLECKARLPVGLGGVPAEVAEVAVQLGDHLVFYSDGVTEARDADGAFFGEAILPEVLAHRPTPDSSELARDIVARSVAYQGGEQRDDATVFVVEFRAWST